MSDLPDSAAAATPPPPAAQGALRVSSSTALVLLLFTIAFTALMALTYEFTKDVIRENALAARRSLISQVLPPEAYDNDLLADSIELPPTAELGGMEPTRAYRARRKGAPVALVLEAAAPDGYSGRIDLLIAVKFSGELAAVRVTNHRETPGLGDYIDPKKDKNKAQPWIEQFRNLGFNQVPPAAWQVKKDGGHFDAHAGATISARAVTQAVGRALRYALNQRERLYSLEPQP